MWHTTLLLKHLKMLNETNILEKTSQTVLNIPIWKEGTHRLKSKKTEETEHLNAMHNPGLDSSFKGTKDINGTFREM